MKRFDSPMSPMLLGLFRYGLAVSSVGLALMLTLVIYPFETHAPLFFPAIMLSAWLGGMGPGLAAALLSILAVAYFVLPPANSVAFAVTDAPFFAAFSFSALLIGWLSASRKRAEDGLRRTARELEAKLRELEQAARQLQIEAGERTRVEEALASQALELSERSRLLDLAHDAILVWDLKGRVRFWNQGAADRYGWPQDDARGKNAHELLRTQFPKPLPEIMTDCLSAGYWEGELLQAKRDGTPVVVSSRWAMEKDETGRPQAILEINNDITERKRAEEDLLKARSELAGVSRLMTMGELTATIAHEVNQPLAAVVANAGACLRWLKGEQPDLSEARAALGRIVRDGRHAGDVVARVRGLLRGSAPRRELVDIGEIIRDVLRLVRLELSRQRIAVQTRLADDLPQVLADRIQLQQVVLNLILNGIDAMSAITERPRKMSIKSHRRDLGGVSGVMVAVEDNGAGVDPANADRLFDPLYTTKESGLGMGLSISRSIVEAHGGRLWVASNPAGGATFYFALPESGETSDD